MSTQLIPPGKLFSELKHIGISKQSGNLLQMRDDGIYYGIESIPDLANLYIDSQIGNDSNPGTTAKPLRTLPEALRRIKSENSPTSTIWLKENQEFNLDSPDTTRSFYAFHLPNTTLKIFTWVTNQTYINRNWQPYYNPTAARDFPRAKIRFKRRITNDRIWCFRDRISLDQFEVRGIEFIIDSDNPLGSDDMYGNFPGIINVDRGKNLIVIADCIFSFNGDFNNHNTKHQYRDDALLRAKTIEWNNSILVNHVRSKHGVIFYSRSQPSVTVYSDNVGEYIGKNGNRNFRSMVQGNQALYTIFNLENIMHWQSLPKRATNTTPGLNISYNIFDYDKTHYL